MCCCTNMLSKKNRTRKARKGRGSRLSFVDLPDDIHVEIARIIDPTICSDPSSHHGCDSDLTNQAYWNSQPNQTLTRLTLVCKRLRQLYGPFSSWRSLHIEAKSPRSAELIDEKFELSPSLERVLKYPETGVYARQLFIQFRGSWKEGFADAFGHGNLVDFDRFLANTPRLDTVRCLAFGVNRRDNVHFPIPLLTSLSRLASLRYLFLGEFDMDYQVPPSLPLLPQVRILRYSPSYGPTILKDLLCSSMPNIETLYITTSRLYELWGELEYIVADIQVRCDSTPSSFLGECLVVHLCLCLSLTYDIIFGLLSVERHHVETEPPRAEFSIQTYTF
jgi:hypothetical protein